MDTRDLQININVGLVTARELVAAFVAAGQIESVEEAFVVYKGLAEMAIEHVIESQNAHTAAPRVAQAFPGTSTVDTTPAPAQTTGNPFGSTGGPAPIPSATQPEMGKDAAWRALLTNFGDFYDNRVNKRNPKGPDFKHKQTGEGLWLSDKNIPSDIRQQLVTAGVIQ